MQNVIYVHTLQNLEHAVLHFHYFCHAENNSKCIHAEDHLSACHILMQTTSLAIVVLVATLNVMVLSTEYHILIKTTYSTFKARYDLNCVESAVKPQPNNHPEQNLTKLLQKLKVVLLIGTQRIKCVFV